MFIIGVVLGNIFMTHGVNNLLDQKKIEMFEIAEILLKYTLCDWGDLCKFDKNLNDNALKGGDISRILGKYKIKDHEFYIITDSINMTKSKTTILLCSEY